MDACCEALMIKVHLQGTTGACDAAVRSLLGERADATRFMPFVTSPSSLVELLCDVSLDVEGDLRWLRDQLQGQQQWAEVDQEGTPRGDETDYSMPRSVPGSWRTLRGGARAQAGSPKSHQPPRIPARMTTRLGSVPALARAVE